MSKTSFTMGDRVEITDGKLKGKVGEVVATIHKATGLEYNVHVNGKTEYNVLHAHLKEAKPQ